MKKKDVILAVRKMLAISEGVHVIKVKDFDDVEDAMGALRLCVVYNKFDLEASGRELDYWIEQALKKGK